MDTCYIPLIFDFILCVILGDEIVSLSGCKIYEAANLLLAAS
jgi:hypothetical protein